MSDLKAFFNKNDRYAHHGGMELVEVSEGKATARMEIKPHHLNGVNTVQGGAIFTLADLAFAAAVNSHGTIAVAINVSISFIKAAESGVLFAYAEETSYNPKLATCTVRVLDDKGNLIAIFQGMAYRKDKPLLLV